MIDDTASIATLLQKWGSPPLKFSDVQIDRSISIEELRTIELQTNRNGTNGGTIVIRDSGGSIDEIIRRARWNVGNDGTIILSTYRPHEIIEKMYRDSTFLESINFISNGEESETLLVIDTHVHDIVLIGLLQTRNEVDFISEVLDNLSKNLDVVYALDMSDDGTDEIIRNHSIVRELLRPEDIPKTKMTDGCKKYLLDHARRDWPNRTRWIFNVQGDELFESDLHETVLLAEKEGATRINVQVPTFILHKSQRDFFEREEHINKSPVDYMTHYIWGGGEYAGAKDFPWIYFNPEVHMKNHPFGIFPSRMLNKWPVRRHYPMRSPQQTEARIQDRLASGWQPNFINYQDIFFENEANGLEMKKYYGWFPELTD